MSVGDSLAPEDVEPLLRGRFGRPYRFVARCASTQLLLGAGAPEGAVVAAGEQTEGRGRLGRGWEAPAGTSLLLSLRLVPDVPGERLPELTVVAARAVAEAVAERAGVRSRLKHPNDVLVGERKLAGVLAEAVNGRVTVGIGVNVNQTAAELPRTGRLAPTSLRLETGRKVERAPLLAAVLERLEREYEAWLEASRG